MKAFAIALLGLSASIGLQATDPPQTRAALAPPHNAGFDAEQARALLGQYCVTCHNERAKAGSLVLDPGGAAQVGSNPAVWEKVVRKLNGRLMPPAGRPRPDEATYERVTEWLAAELDSFAAAHPNPGRTETFHRLNRAEYQNAIRDLLALDVDVSGLLPADDAAFGFDNIGGVFRLSPALMESYLAAARKISRMAMGTPSSVLDEGQVYLVPRSVQQNDRVEGMGFGTRGGSVVHHLFPQNAEYSFSVDLGNMMTLTDPHTMELTVDGVQVQVFEVVRVGSVTDTSFEDKGLTLKARFPVVAGPHDVGVAFYSHSKAVPEILREPFKGSSILNSGGPVPTVKAITIGGPYGSATQGDTPSRRRILTCHPTTGSQDTACARAIVSTLARRAFRRPVSDPDLKGLLAFYTESRTSGDGFEAAIEKVVRRVLASPKFLFRREAEPPAPSDHREAHPYRVNDIELASRLSFFLWSSIPDDRLIDVAAQGRLKDPAVLSREVRRMIADPRSKALTTNFASQWLQLRKLESTRPGADYGKNFDDALKDGFRRETELFFDSIVREDRPVTELLTANYTYLNERVARHYGIRDVAGSHFRRVTLPADNPRRGLLGQGSILTLTSQAIRTSPVIRGKYILETLLGTPPPEPPPNVPSLTEGKAGSRPKTMRERMAAHRANPACAGCHAMLDPLGFGLENFDPVGSWRDVEDGFQKVDASGEVPDGSKFDSFVELRTLLTRRPQQLVATATEKLLTYALGRGLEPYDMPAVRNVVAEAARHDYRFQSIVLGIVSSYPFQMRNPSAPAPAAESASR